MWGLLLATAALPILISLFSWKYQIVQADETTVAWMAKQVAMGRVPYGDFFSFLPPLTLYGLAAFFKAFGATLAGFRLLTILWIVASTLLLYRLFLKAGMRAPWAAGLAFQLPALLVPFWPVSSHHWFALGLGLAAVLAGLNAQAEPSAGRWFLAGLTAGLAALCVQSDGLIFFVVVAALFAQSPPSRTSGRMVAAGLAGLLAPAVPFALLLGLQGSLGWAYYDLVTWPARFYKQPGGFNDVQLVTSIREALREALARGPSSSSVLSLVPFAGALALAVLPLVGLAASPAWLGGPRRPSPRWVWAATGMGATLAVLLRGRPDWAHLVMLTPILVALGALEIHWEAERVRPAVAKALIALMVVIALVRWPSFWVHRPPLLAEVLDTDRAVQEFSYPKILREVPDAVAKRSPILCLPRGATLYFYWAPVPPPLDWLMPPSSRADAPWEYARLAQFADDHRVPYILVRPEYAPQFLEEPSPLASLLRMRYRLLKRLPWGDLFERIPDEPATH